MILDDIILKTRRHETPFYNWFYNFLKSISRLEFPYIKPLHKFLYSERNIRRTLFHWIVMKIYYEPLFKSQCVSVGKNFKIIRGNIQGIPYIVGKPYIEIGDNVTIHSVITFSGNKIYDRPTLKIGNNTVINSRVSFSVAREITIGDHCYLADDIIIRDNDGHPVDFKLRMKNKSADKKDVKPVAIGNYVWIGASCIILKGVLMSLSGMVEIPRLQAKRRLYMSLCDVIG